jgi:hypothetical protein
MLIGEQDTRVDDLPACCYYKNKTSGHSDLFHIRNHIVQQYCFAHVWDADSWENTVKREKQFCGGSKIKLSTKKANMLEYYNKLQEYYKDNQENIDLWASQ